MQNSTRRTGRKFCANCKAPLTRFERERCRRCAWWLEIYTATIRAAQLIQRVQP